MDKIIEINGTELQQLIYELTQNRKAYKLRVSVDGDTVKFKMNSGMWSPPMGHLDPECWAAQHPQGG
jgi:hypothetical protein